MTISSTALVFLVWLAQAAPAPSAPAVAPDAKAQAKALLSEGSALYRAGNYAGALEKFEAAYAAFPSSKLWFNIGQANRDLGRPVEAMQAFEKFLARGTEAPADTIADARSSINALQAKLGQVRIDCEVTGAMLSMDGKELGPAPLPNPAWATPGRHQITATHESGPLTIESANVVIGEITTVTVTRAKPVAPPPPALDTLPVPVMTEAPTQGWWLGRKWTWVAAGGAVVAGGVGATVGILAKRRFDDLKGSCGSGSPTRPGCDENDISNLRTRMTTANVLFGVAGAAAATAAVLFFVEDSKVSVTPVAGETTGMVARVAF
jgi:hypothetical protein